ncbi:zinc finger BED domain-containing protein DAYSLEEPER-like protein [Tanacetum coccineum]
MHDYPLHIVEHPGFIAFVHNLQPRFDMVNFSMVQGDCIATYLREKQAIQQLIEGMPGRICLTLDLWNSCQTTGYVFVTGQFVDTDWKIHCKLLNVVMEPYPESDSAFSHAVSSCPTGILKGDYSR